jgi:hypothetical protein
VKNDTPRLARQEMLRRYPDAEATMGDGKVVGETGPDVAGKNLSPTTVKVCVSRAMFTPTLSYSYSSRGAIPKTNAVLTLFRQIIGFWINRNSSRNTFTIR